MCQPNLLLSRTLQENKQLAKLYVDALVEKPSSREHPWHLIVCFDEFTPGSISHPQMSRKTMDVAFNFLELGQAVLGIPATWMARIAVRAKKMSDAIGGWSACLAVFLRILLVGDLGMETVGVPFSFEGKVYKTFAKLECLLSDGEGLKSAWSVTGWAGIRPCIRCQNVLKKGSDLAWRSDAFVEIGCADHAKFVLSTPQDLEREISAIEDFAAGGGSAARLQGLETAYGIKANLRGTLFCPILQQRFSILHVIHEDWMHGALQDGCMTIAFQLFMRSCREKLGLRRHSHEAKCGFEKIDISWVDWAYSAPAGFLWHTGRRQGALFRSATGGR